MKAFAIIWYVIMVALLIVGWVWYYADRKSEKRSKIPLILLAVGNVMLVIVFLVILPILNK
ncbi:MAG: hypothetical protein J6T09_00060 [Bacteroidales bacterium]|nr:hypothetical protein [Bacteroidales bacterium]